jgi:hypothetical protein
MKVSKEIVDSLLECFPTSFINDSEEFIAYPRTNLYFNLGNCETLLDVKCKILEWFSRDCHKAMPFRSHWRNDEYHKLILDRVNEFLGTDFTIEDMAIIYQKLGNAIRHSLTIKFVESDYDLRVLKQGKEKTSLLDFV